MEHRNLEGIKKSALQKVNLFLSEGAESYLTPDELASLLDLHPRTLANWRHYRKGPDFIKVGSRVRYPVSSVVEWLNEHKILTRL